MLVRGLSHPNLDAVLQHPALEVFPLPLQAYPQILLASVPLGLRPGGLGLLRAWGTGGGVGVRTQSAQPVGEASTKPWPVVGRSKAAWPLLGKVTEPIAAACDGSKAVTLRKGLSREIPSFILIQARKSCLENRTRRWPWEELSARVRGRKGSRISRVGGVSVSSPLDFGFVYCGLINVSAFKQSLLALMCGLQRAAPRCHSCDWLLLEMGRAHTATAPEIELKLWGKASSSF